MFIRNLQFRQDEFITMITNVHKNGRGFIELTDVGLVSLLNASERAQREMKRIQAASGKKKPRQQRRPNLNLTNKDAERLRKLAQQHPEMKQEQLSVLAGFYEDTINKCTTLFWINDWQTEATLANIVKFARIERDRTANGRFTAEEVDQMRITNRFSMGEN